MSACLPWYTEKKKMQLTSWLGMSANSLSTKDFFHISLWKSKIGTYSLRTVSQRASLQARLHSSPIPAPSCASGSSQNTPHLCHACPQRAGDAVPLLGWSSWEERKRSFQLCSFFLFSSLQCLPSFLVQNTSVAWSYSSLHWAFIAEAQRLLLFLLMVTWASSSCATEKHLLNEAAMRSMLYDFQEQNSLQLAEGLVFDSFLWLFYNCLQIFSSFKLFWKVLGGSQKLFCASMCLLAWIQESF